MRGLCDKKVGLIAGIIILAACVTAGGQEHSTKITAFDDRFPAGSKGHLTSLNNLGVALAKEGRYEDAAKVLSQAAEFSPEMYQTYRNLSIVYDHLNRPNDALAAARRAVEAAPAEPVALIQWCEVALEYSKDRMEALSCYKRLESIAPLDQFSMGQYGIALYRAARFDDALAVLTKACAGPIENADLLNALGLTHFEKKRYKAAALAFKRAVEIDPDRGFLRFNLGVAQMADRNRAGALSQYRLLKDGHPALANRLYKLLYRNLIVSADDFRKRGARPKPQH